MNSGDMRQEVELYGAINDITRLAEQIASILDFQEMAFAAASVKREYTDSPFNLLMLTAHSVGEILQEKAEDIAMAARLLESAQREGRLTIEPRRVA